jgi:hypothetical protein
VRAEAVVNVEKEDAKNLEKEDATNLEEEDVANVGKEDTTNFGKEDATNFEKEDTTNVEKEDTLIKKVSDAPRRGRPKVGVVNLIFFKTILDYALVIKVNMSIFIYTSQVMF